jgi:hypothetical protein
MSHLHEAQRNNAIGRLEAGKSQTAVAAEHHILPLENRTESAMYARRKLDSIPSLQNRL